MDPGQRGNLGIQGDGGTLGSRATREPWDPPAMKFTDSFSWIRHHENFSIPFHDEIQASGKSTDTSDVFYQV